MTEGTARAGLALMHGGITSGILGAFFDVYNELGYGFAESVYQRSMVLALSARDLKCEREVPLTVHFRGEVVGDYRADIVVANKVIVECKVADRIVNVHEMQIVNYLRATGITVGLVLNFGPTPTFKRLLLTTTQKGSAIIRS